VDAPDYLSNALRKPTPADRYSNKNNFVRVLVSFLTVSGKQLVMAAVYA
jgi:hypothetical protein